MELLKSLKKIYADRFNFYKSMEDKKIFWERRAEGHNQDFFYDVKASFLKVMTSRLGVSKLLPQFLNS